MKPPLLADPAIETAPQLDEGTQSLKRGRTGAVLGVASAALLFASFRWAHHWGLLSGAVVAAWIMRKFVFYTITLLVMLLVSS